MSRRVRDQAGLAMPVAIIVLALAMLLTSALMLSATRSSRGSNRDLSAKRSLQVADAGIDVARDDVARLKLGTAECVGRNEVVNGAAPAGSVFKRAATSAETEAKACAPVRIALADGTSLAYTISLGVTPRTVSSSGATSQGIPATRRVASDLAAGDGAVPLFGNWAVSSRQSTQFTNNNTIVGDVRVGGDLEMNSSAEIVGNLSVGGTLRMENNSRVCGPGNVAYGVATAVNPWSSARICGATSQTARPFSDAPIPPALVPTVPESSNWRLCRMQSSAASSDLCGGEVWARGLDDSRTLTIGSNASVTLTGSDKPYLLCAITTYGNGRLVVPAGRRVTIVIDRPENCSGANPAGGMHFTNNLTVDNQNCPDANQASASDTLQFYVLGSTSIATRVEWNSNSTGCATMYAPESEVYLTNNVRFYGAVTGLKVATSSNARIITTKGSQSVTIPGDGGAGTSNYRECVLTETGTGGCETS